VASKSRFGLFSQPPPLAIGDDSLFRSQRRSYPLIKPAKVKTASRKHSQETCWLDLIGLELIRKATFSQHRVSMLVTCTWTPRRSMPAIIKSSIRDQQSMSSSSNQQVDAILCTSSIIQGKNTL
jgi:hypothetical protein